MHYKNFDGVAEVYEKTRAVPMSLKLFFRAEIFNKLYSIGKSAYNLLSLGIGTGRIEDILNTPHTTVFGIDISIEMLKMLNQKRLSPPVFITLADCQTIPFHGHFDAIIIIHLTHLVEKWENLIEDVFALTDFLILSEIYTDIYSHPFYRIYINELKKNNWKKEDIGLRVREFIAMTGKKYSNMDIETSFTFAEVKITNSYVLELIQKRYLSSFWSVPNDLHDNALNALMDYISTQKINLSESSTTRSFCRIFFCRKKRTLQGTDLEKKIKEK